MQDFEQQLRRQASVQGYAVLQCIYLSLASLLCILACVIEVQIYYLYVCLCWLNIIWWSGSYKCWSGLTTADHTVGRTPHRNFHATCVYFYTMYMCIHVCANACIHVQCTCMLSWMTQALLVTTQTAKHYIMKTVPVHYLFSLVVYSYTCNMHMNFSSRCVCVLYVYTFRVHLYVVCGDSESGSARYNADRKAKTVQARIEANLTSQGVTSSNSGLTIFSREPNKKNSVYIGNMNWV